MCHIRAGLLLLSIMVVPLAAAMAQGGSIEQSFSNSLVPVPGETLAVHPGAFYVPVYSSVAMSQGRLRPISR